MKIRGKKIKLSIIVHKLQSGCIISIIRKSRAPKTRPYALKIWPPPINTLIYTLSYNISHYIIIIHHGKINPENVICKEVIMVLDWIRSAGPAVATFFRMVSCGFRRAFRYNYVHWNFAPPPQNFCTEILPPLVSVHSNLCPPPW